MALVHKRGSGRFNGKRLWASLGKELGEPYFRAHLWEVVVTFKRTADGVPRP